MSRGKSIIDYLLTIYFPSHNTANYQYFAKNRLQSMSNDLLAISGINI